MSSGRTHATIAIGVGATITCGALIATSHERIPYNDAVSLIVGAWVGWLITPDADVNGRSEEEQRMWNLFGPLGFAFQIMMYPYALLFKHRGVSHWHVVGTLTRLVYLILVSLVVTRFWNEKTLSILIDTLYENQRSIWIAFISWTFQDSVHIITDKISTWSKRRAK